MISQAQAFSTDIFHDSAAIDVDSGQCVIWRRCNSTTTWPGKPESFSTPVVNDAGISGAVTEMNAGLFHAEEDCPQGYKHGQATASSMISASQLSEDIITPPQMIPESLGSREPYIHRVLRYQLTEKLNEIQAGLGMTDLQMMEVVARWMQTKARSLRDAEVNET